MTEDSYPGLVNQFLIAMPELQDPNFSRTVTLICQHDANGALGVVINRPLEQLTLKDILDQFNLSLPETTLPIGTAVYVGGPVQQQLGLVLHEEIGDWGSTLKISDNLGLTSSRDILESISSAEGPDHALLTLGYAGWGPGQLDEEIQANGWLNVQADDDLIFGSSIDLKWERAMAKMGIDFSKLSGAAGHA